MAFTGFYQLTFRVASLPIPILAFIFGICIAILGYISNGETFGTGYQEAKTIIQSGKTLDPFFPLYKMLATCATFFSGIPGGIFVPSIATGAGFGANLAYWLPIAPAGAMILLTITAYFSGMLRSPLTSFVIVMEMTSSQEMVIPLMAAASFASGTSRIMNPTPLYRALCDAYQPPPEKPQEIENEK